MISCDSGTARDCYREWGWAEAPSRPGVDTVNEDTCTACQYFIDDPAAIEAEFPFLTVLGSAYASTRGEAGICVVQGRFMDPVPMRSCTVKDLGESRGLK